MCGVGEKDEIRDDVRDRLEVTVVCGDGESWDVGSDEILYRCDPSEIDSLSKLYTYVLALQVVDALVVRVDTLPCDRGDIVPQPKPVELVVLQRSVRLRHEPVEVVGATLQVDKDFERYDALAELVNSRGRERLQTRQGSEVPWETRCESQTRK